MSSSDPTSAIFMSDTKNEVKKKINKYAFSGGRVSIEEHRKLGGNADVDVSYQYLTYFLDDDEELERIRTQYTTGQMLTGELKNLCIQVMQKYVEEFQTSRKAVTDDVLKMYMTPRKLEWNGNRNPRSTLQIESEQQRKAGEDVDREAEERSQSMRPFSVRGLSSMASRVVDEMYPKRAKQGAPS